MNSLRLNRLWPVWLLLIVVGGGFGLVRAADTDPAGMHLTVSPVYLDLTAKPGEELNAEVKIKNGTAHDEQLQIGLVKFGAYDEVGHPSLQDVLPDDPFKNWISFSEPVFTAPAGEWKTIKVKLKIPANVGPSYYYGITFGRVNEGFAGGSQLETKLAGMTSILLLLQTETSGATRQLDLAEFSTDHRWYTYLPVTFTVRLQNTGTVHVVPYGNIFVQHGGHDLATLDVNKEQGNVLPGSIRRFQPVWSDGFPVYQPVLIDGATKTTAKGQAVMKLTWDPATISHIRFGKYTAKLVMVYQDGGHDVPIEGYVTFYVVPWPIIVVAVILLLLIIFGAYTVIRLVRIGLRSSKHNDD